MSTLLKPSSKIVVLRVVFKDTTILNRDMTMERALDTMRCFFEGSISKIGEMQPSNGGESPWCCRLDDVRWMDIIPWDDFQKQQQMQAQQPPPQQHQFGGRFPPGVSGVNW